MSGDHFPKLGAFWQKYPVNRVCTFWRYPGFEKWPLQLGPKRPKPTNPPQIDDELPAEKMSECESTLSSSKKCCWFVDLSGQIVATSNTFFHLKWWFCEGNPMKFQGNLGWWNIILGDGFKHFIFSTLLGEDFQFDKYFSDGLKPPTSIYNLPRIFQRFWCLGLGS